MMQICRAEDGHVFQVNASLRDIERTGNLEFFLHQETGVDPEAVLAYLPDGRRLTNNNIRELAGSSDQSIFVFNKYYLDYPLEEVLRELKVEAPLQPVEDNVAATPPFRLSHLATSYLRVAHTHHDHINRILSTLNYQHEAIRIASSSLDLNVLAIVDTFESIAVSSRKELQKQTLLLAGLEADLDIISRVGIHVEFLSPAVRRATEAGEKQRTLGDYVSNVKMKQLTKDVSQKTSLALDDLQARFNSAELAVSRLTEGTDVVRSTLSKTNLLDDAEASLTRAQDLVDKITDTAAALEGPIPDPDGILQELKRLDNALRNELQFVTDAKNAYTEQCLGALRRISILNDEMVQIPPILASLQSSFRGKNSFSHIQRLHNMLYAYGATVIEIVRRKEFSRFFYQRAQNILEVMAKLSASERKRRQVYRSEVHGQLPFETRGMDDQVPTIDFSPSGNLDTAYSLERDDIDGLLLVLDDLEQFARSSDDSAALNAVQECRAALDKLIARMDSLESGFDRIAEKSLLSASRLSSSRRRTIEADELAYQEMVEQLRMMQELKMDQESQFQEERTALQADMTRLQSGLQDAEATISSEQERANRMEGEFQQARSQVESEVNARRNAEARNVELSANVESQRQELSRASADATAQAETIEELRQELAQLRVEFDEVRALEERHAAKISSLLQDQADSLQHLEDARGHGEDLESQIRAILEENEELNHILGEATREKDRLLRAQASEHDRIVRDHIAEADGDRAVLEGKFFELKTVHEDTERQLKDARAENEVANADAVGLREELQRVEHELREARHIERVLRDDLRAGRTSQSDFEQQSENDSRLIAQILDVAMAFRATHVKALHSAQAMTAHPNSASKQSFTAPDTIFPSGMRHNVIGQPDEPSPIDPSDPHAALEALRAFDHDHFLEALAKTGSTIRKWQKQCKEYRERAKGKISFRNFAKGDLALFLPTRNSESKPWAAFNVSFPHYFLKATGHLAEQLKTREWIVARITSITERVVDQKNPSSNPYSLGEGVKYYMLEVEDWTQQSQHNKRKTSRKVSTEKEPKPLTLANPDLPPGPPEAEVEDSFNVTHPSTSRLFPARGRSNSSSNTRPSSLSRLLAQATPEPQPESIPPLASTSPSPTSQPPLLSPSHYTGSAPHPVPTLASPLRPGSRASRMSSASKFSVGRIPPLGSVSSSPSGPAKAAATTALSDQLLISSSSGDDNPFISPASPSIESPRPEGINMLQNRRRTTSYHIPRTSPLAGSSTSHVSESASTTDTVQPTSTATSALVNLASSWGVSLGRKKQARQSTLATTITRGGPDTSASELLKRF